MFGFGIQELLIILAIILLFFGPKKLPELAKSFGKGIKEFKNASKEVRADVEFKDGEVLDETNSDKESEKRNS